MKKGDMCTNATRTTPLILTIVICSMMLVTEGRPIYRREHGTEDLIAGEAFLSVLMGSRAQRSRYIQPSTTEDEPPITKSSMVRGTRSSPQQNLPRTFPEKPSDKVNLSQVNNNLEYSKQSSDSLSANKKTIVSVSVSSSVADEEGKDVSDLKGDDLVETTTDAATTFESAVASEIHPSIISEASKSDFSVEEGEPITRNHEPLPSPHPLSYEEGSYPNKNKGYQGTVIFHNNPREPNRARSVSYSTVIQSIPEQKPWKKNSTQDEGKSDLPNNSAAESKDYYVTSKYNPSDYNESVDKRKYESSSRRYYETTERNWGIPERNYGVPPTPQKPYTPIVYGQPEQNYEVDEAVSVETNGRAHGVQPSRAEDKTKKDDNQKVGYVVEGRNYRKYRVEERTSDGFIVGEYGVVSHDDGSLRGVRYTADGTINPRLIYDALMKFLSL